MTTIMIIDNDCLSNESILSAFEIMEYQVYSAKKLFTSEFELIKDQIQYLIVNISILSQQEISYLKRLKKELIGLKIIVISNIFLTEMYQFCAEYLLDHYMSKPILFSKLLHVITK
ncbi:MAG: response regulator [Candidatus Cloacimonetes bacterium]|nr:response regulator [Candidatus Cloacimonadota bacterium]